MTDLTDATDLADDPHFNRLADFDKILEDLKRF